MTDNEIITVDIEKYAKALNNLIGVDSAYFKGDKDVDTIVEIIVMAKKMEGIINRQKAEIERLKKQSEYRRDYLGYFPKLERTEAIKEFAEKLLDKYDIWTESDATEYRYVEELVDSLVKEMVGRDIRDI